MAALFVPCLTCAWNWAKDMLVGLDVCSCTATQIVFGKRVARSQLATGTEDASIGIKVACCPGPNCDACPACMHACTTQDGVTPLYCACKGGSTEVVAALLARGADPTIASDNGAAPLHQAAENGYCGVVELLLATGKLDVNKGKGDVSDADD